VGYNPINGESYSTKDNVNSKTTENNKQPESTVQTTEEQNGNAQVASTNSAENDNVQVTSVNTTENGNTQAAPTSGNAQKPVEKTDNVADGNNAQKVR